MDEPVKKKFKTDKNDIQDELEVLYKHLLRNCLCQLAENILENLTTVFRDVDLFKSNVTARWSKDRVLMLICTMQLMCDVALKQHSKQYVCRKIAHLCDVLIQKDNNLVDYFIQFANDSDKFICFSAGRTLSSLFLIANSQIKQDWLYKLVDNILDSSYNYQVSFSLDVIKRIIEWKEVDKYVLNDTVSASVEGGRMMSSSSCNRILLSESDFDAMKVKNACIKALKRKWQFIVKRFYDLICSRSFHAYQSEIVTFLDLWRIIISVKANLSVIDTKVFYSNLNNFVVLRNVDYITPIVWMRILDLFNEVLCYGSTLALQEVLADEPRSLATLIVRNVKDKKLLSAVLSRKRNVKLGCMSDDPNGSNKTLLQKVILLVLKAVAVTVKETRYDSSSDSSLGSEADEDLAVIKRSIQDVLELLDDCTKKLLPFHPATKLAQWVVQLYCDQDDALIESMVCCLDVNTGLCYHDNVSDLFRMLNPTVSFLQFLHAVSFDFDVLLDFLVSNETCFLLYLLRFLKYVCRNWQEFFVTCGPEIDRTMNVLIRLRIAIKRLCSKNLFPYNIKPVLGLLNKCEELYNNL